MTNFAVIAAILIVSASSPAFADQEKRSAAAKRDLAAVQGKWEWTARAGGETIRSVQTINDTTSSVERFDAQGKLLASHTAQFELRVTDEVRIFTFSDLEVTSGPDKGAKVKGPRSFVYAINGNTLVEARGLLVNQPEGAPRLIFWKRPAVDAGAAAQNASTPREQTGV